VTSLFMAPLSTLLTVPFNWLRAIYRYSGEPDYKVTHGCLKPLRFCNHSAQATCLAQPLNHLYI